MSSCLNHPDSPAVTRCAVCGKPLCEKCVVMAEYCSESCCRGAKAAGERISQNHLDRKRSSSSWIRPFAIILILAALGFCAYHYYWRNKKLSVKLSKQLEQVKQKTSSSVQDGRNYLNRDSRYKRSREGALE